jgi:hypothetical protein
MPTGSERTVWGMGDGSMLEVVPTELGRLGGLICWENYMHWPDATSLNPRAERGCPELGDHHPGRHAPSEPRTPDDRFAYISAAAFGPSDVLTTNG